MHKALLTRRQRLRRLRELRSSGTTKAAAGGAAVLALLGVIILCATAGVVFTVYRGYADDLPAEPRSAFAKQVLGPARIYDRNGTLLYEFEDENDGLRNPITLQDVSEWAIKATIATEDNSFYDNPGVNVRGLARAGIENFLDVDAGALQGTGGSSITQQLVKNVFIPEDQRYERSPDRKLKEAVLALELTRKYSKNQILEWYLNQIQYGNRTNGIEAASRRYFGQHAKDLTLAQAALLAGLPQAPALYDPFRNPDAAVYRQHEVLDLMVRHGHITEEEAVAAKAEPLVYASSNVDLKAPHWVFYVRDLLINQFGEETFKSGGLRVTTTLDLPLQDRAEQIVKARIAEFEGPPNNCQCHNGALITIDNNTGEILAMVGSRDYWRLDIEGENNNAIAIKQPGSALKPLVYTAAFMKGWNPATVIYDQPTKFYSKTENGKKEYFTPVGPLRNYVGGLSARNSLGNSMNTAAVKAAAWVGVSNFIDVAHRLGITTMDDKENYGASIATGGSNITLLDLTYAYSVFANNGEMRGSPALGPRHGVPPAADHRKLDPVAILEVTDANGKVMYQYDRANPGRDQVVPAGYAYEITDILKDNDAKKLTYNAPEFQFSIGNGRPVAAKTGTQQGPETIGSVLSTWNFGYTPDLTVGVWVGNQDNKLVNSNLTSAASSLYIWKDFMVAANEMLGLPPKEFKVPPDIKWVMFNGKREPLVDAQIQKFVPAEDLKLWAADGNSTSPSGGPVYGNDCRAVPGRDQRGQEVTTLQCSGGQPSSSSIGCYDSFTTDANGQTRTVQVCPSAVPRAPVDQSQPTGTPRPAVGRPQPSPTPVPAATPYPTLAPLPIPPVTGATPLPVATSTLNQPPPAPPPPAPAPPQPVAPTPPTPP